jgi:hypothetical protein
MADESTDTEIDPEDIEAGFDVEEAPDDLDDDIDGDDDVAFVEPVDLDDDAVVLEDEEQEAVEVVAPKAKRDDDDADEDDDEEADPDDVEADLDTILKDRIAAAPDDEEEEEEEEATEADDRGEPGGGRIQPRRPGEFVCQSCFLLKHPSQLADRKKQLCNDCV